MEHNLQHISKLYETQTVVNINHYELQGKINILENRFNTLQGKVERLTNLVEKAPSSKKRKAQS